MNEQSKRLEWARQAYHEAFARWRAVGEPESGPEWDALRSAMAEVDVSFAAWALAPLFKLVALAAVSMNEEQRRLARDLGALADRLSSEPPLFGPQAKAGDEVVLDDGTRVVLAEDADNGRRTVEARVTLAPELAARLAGGPRLPPQPRPEVEDLLEGEGDPSEWWKVRRARRP